MIPQPPGCSLSPRDSTGHGGFAIPDATPVNLPYRLTALHCTVLDCTARHCTLDSMSLTDTDRGLIARARELAAADNEFEITTAIGPADDVSYSALIGRAFKQSQNLLGQLADLAERLTDDDDDPEPYCSTCGATIGIFQGHGDNWHHFTGNGTVADPNKLYDADHEPVVAWREPSSQRLAGSHALFTVGQLVTVIDGGWTGIIERIDAELGAAYVRFPDRPDLVPYAFEALGQAS